MPSKTASTSDLRSLKNEPRHALPTSEAARHLSLQPQTLRAWAHYGTGPITPITVNGRLYWPVDALLRVLNGDTEISDGGAL
jgi:hypothetical protein